MGSGGTQVPEGNVFGGDGAVQGRRGERAVHRRGDEEAAVYRQQSRHQVGAGQPGRLLLEAEERYLEYGSETESDVDFREAQTWVRPDSLWR